MFRNTGLPSRAFTSSVISMPCTDMPVQVLNGSVIGFTSFGFFATSAFISFW